MKNFSFILFVWLSCVGVHHTSAQEKFNARKFIGQVLYLYSPTHNDLIDKYSKTPTSVHLPNTTFNVGKRVDYMFYITDTINKTIILHDLPQMVYEITNDYANRGSYAYLEKNKITYNAGDNYICYYINQQTEYTMKQIRSFPSIQIANIIPKKLHTENYYRFLKNSNPEVPTQKYGIYGLMQEWNAYQHATKVAFNVKRYYEREGYTDITLWEDFFANYYEYQTAYSEFKYFILKYLEYAENSQPDFYENLLKDAKFKKTYIEIDKNYEDTIAQFNLYKPAVFSLLNKASVTTEETSMEGFSLLFLDRVGINTYGNIDKLFREALEDDALKQIEKKIKN